MTKPLVSLSSCWLSQRHQDGYAMVQEVASLGFDHIELSHGLRITLVPGVLRAVEEGLIQVSSCHNFCPLPAGISHPAPNLFQPSSQDPRELDQWLRNTRRSIDFAAQVGSSVLVCHLGSVGFFWFDPSKRIHAYLEGASSSDLREDKAFEALRSKALGRLRKRMPRYWSSLLSSVNAVLEHAANKGVRLGFENREGFCELPLDSDFTELFKALPEGAPVGYWHDAGHADIKEKLGLLQHLPHLEAQSARLLGFHLHDVTPDGRDHQEIGSGRIDFAALSRFWRPEHRLVLEFSPRLSVEQVLASKDRIDALRTPTA